MTGWVIENLNTYGNSVIPAKEVRKYGISRLEEAIYKGEGIRVKITKRDTKVLDPVSHRYRKDTDLYVAEVVR